MNDEKFDRYNIISIQSYLLKKNDASSKTSSLFVYNEEYQSVNFIICEFYFKFE